ncbi:MAG: phosphate ABC transporter permease PstA [Candidatus Dormibacteraeota bacterium]|uniref:Phosphate transport system permease protein PstA n=1 Tax=Candidatus Amunia macphersoniae TaxID=3127014 RepID=A0A934KG69_9BACT|nr:phosphate ABC transporter permease PstA [Candidatus Dormibacteraeota bacterium]
MIRAIAIVFLLLVVYVLLYTVVQGWSELTRGAFYTSPPSTDHAGSGAGPQIFNTFYLLILTVILTVPSGLAAGIYFAEYAGTGRLVNAIRRATETLATLPSIVVGLFGYALFVQATGSHPSRLAASLALTVIALPYAVRITEDALRSLPTTLRESSLALGATRWQTITRVLLPAALPQLVTGVILISGRAFGEAAAVLFTGTVGTPTAYANYSLSPFLPGDSLAVNLYVFRSQVEPGTVPDAAAYADGVAALLILLVLVFNIAARYAARHAVRRLQGAI